MNECKTVKLKCPENFIKYNVPSGTNDNDYKDCVAVDECLQDEILYLWSLGIKTAGCCCGHGQYDGFINVFDESIDDMISLGYELWDWNKMYPNEKTRPDFAYNRKDTFKAKTLCKKVSDGNDELNDFKKSTINDLFNVNIEKFIKDILSIIGGE